MMSFPRTSFRIIPVLTIGLALLLSGCGEDTKSWNNEYISGVMPDLKFQLTDENGKTVSEKTFQGKVSLIYFGYTHCPDVCPMTLSVLTQALKKMEQAKAEDVRILFVSVDPKRDSPAILKQYAHAFAPQVEGLTGTRDQLEALTKRYRVSYSYGDPDKDGNYEVYHSSAIFVFDGKGKIKLLAREDSGTDKIAQDLTQLVDQSS